MFDYNLMPIMSTGQDHNTTAHHDAFCEVFYQSFAHSEGEAEGQNIKALVHDFLTTTHSQDIYAFTASQSSDDNQQTQLVGAVVFTRLSCEADIRLFMLSPMAILPSIQGKGVGQALIQYAFAHLKQEGVDAVVTYGDVNFYGKVGFEQISEDRISAPQPLSMPEGWLAISLTGEAIPNGVGKTHCVQAINDAKFW